MGPLENRRIAFVGGGNMAEALIRGLIEGGAARRDSISASDPNAERRYALERSYGIAVHADNREGFRGADVLVLAVKPQSIPAVSSELVDYRGLLVSVAAGVRTSTLEAASPARVVRAMPNTPAIVGAGITAIAAGARALDEDLTMADALFASVGRAVRVAESSLDAVTGLSGSGPAYVMLVVEAMIEGGVRVGLPRDLASILAVDTVAGAARLIAETGEAPEALRARVSSPGGTTLAGLARLEAARVREAFIDAVEAATRRSSELGS